MRHIERKILLVDDCADDREFNEWMLKDFAKKYHAEFVHYNNFEEGLAALKAMHPQKPFSVVCDYSIPVSKTKHDTDGVKFAKAVNDMGIPCTIMAGQDKHNMKRQLEEAGLTGKVEFVHKESSLGSSELSEAVEKAIIRVRGEVKPEENPKAEGKYKNLKLYKGDTEVSYPKPPYKAVTLSSVRKMAKEKEIAVGEY